jgi:hypothetical protein
VWGCRSVELAEMIVVAFMALTIINTTTAAVVFAILKSFEKDRLKRLERL